MRIRSLITVGAVILLCGQLAHASKRKDLPTSSAGQLNNCDQDASPPYTGLYLSYVLSLPQVTKKDASGTSYTVHVDIYDWGTLVCPAQSEDRTAETSSVYFVYVVGPDGQTLQPVDLKSLEISLPLNNPNFLVCSGEFWALCNAPVDDDYSDTYVLQPSASPGSDPSGKSSSTVWSFSDPYDLAVNSVGPVPLNSGYSSLPIQSTQSYNIGEGAAVLLTDGTVQCTPAAAQCNNLTATTPYSLTFTALDNTVVTAESPAFAPLNPAPASAAGFDTNQKPMIITGGGFSSIYDASANLPQYVEGTPSEVITFNCPADPSSPLKQYRSVWFEYTPPVNTVIYASTAGSHYDTVLSVTATPAADTPATQCNDDSDPNKIGVVTSQLTFNATEGASYLFLVTEYPPEMENLDGSPYTASLSGDSTLYFTLSTPQIGVSPNSSLPGFGTETVGKTSAVHTVTITSNTMNFGGSGVTGITASATGDFQVSPQSCATPLPDSGPACTLNVTFTPSQVGSRTGSLKISSSGAVAAENAPVTLTLSGAGIETPTVTVTPSLSSVTTTQSLTVTVTVSGGNGNPTPTGSVVLTGGGYTSPAQTLANGSTIFTIQAGKLAVGSDTLTATYTPDSSSSSSYNTAPGTNSVTVNPAASFTLTPSAAALSVVQGSSNTDTITVNSTNGFNSSVTLSASGLPGGVTASFSTNPTSGSSVLTLSATGSATVGGPTPVTITGTSDSLTVTTIVALTVTAAPSFSLGTSAGTLAVVQGNNNTDTITVTGANGFNGGVTLSASGLPSGVTASFGTNPATGPSVLTLTAASSATVGGPVTVTITGTSGSLTASTTIALMVSAAPTFVVGGTSSTLSLVPGATTGNTIPITVTPSNGFTGTVTLTWVVSPTTANDTPTCTLTPSSVAITGTAAQSSTLTIFTTPPTSASIQMRKLLWPSAGTALALLLFGVPRRRRNWLTMFGVLALAVSFGAIGCSGSPSPPPQGNPGTTPGTYTVTVTGTSGNITGTVGTVTLTVQ